MSSRLHQIDLKNGRLKKRSLIKAIEPKAFWSHPAVAPSKVPDGKLIEKVLIHGNDAERKALFEIFPADKIRRVWERRLVIQEPRLHNLNLKIASSLLHIQDPENHIREAYKKYNLYDRFSAKNA